MPAGAVYVGRPTLWGNPFGGENGHAAASYRRWLLHGNTVSPMLGVTICCHDRPECRERGDCLRRREILTRLPELRGRDLACWCGVDQACHADVLIDLANAGGSPHAG